VCRKGMKTIILTAWERKKRETEKKKKNNQRNADVSQAEKRPSGLQRSTRKRKSRLTIVSCEKEKKPASKRKKVAKHIEQKT